MNLPHEEARHQESCVIDLIGHGNCSHLQGDRAAPAALLAASLPLDRRRGLGADVQDDPVDAAHLVDDAVGDGAQDVVG